MKIRFSSSLSNEKPVTYKITDRLQRTTTATLPKSTLPFKASLRYRHQTTYHYLPVRSTACAKITDHATLYLALHRAKIRLCALPFKASLRYRYQTTYQYLPVRSATCAKITDRATLYLALHRAKIRLCALPFKSSLQPKIDFTLFRSRHVHYETLHRCLGPSGDASRNNGHQQRARFCWVILLPAEVPIRHLGKTILQSLAQQRI